MVAGVTEGAENTIRRNNRSIRSRTRSSCDGKVSFRRIRCNRSRNSSRSGRGGTGKSCIGNRSISSGKISGNRSRSDRRSDRRSGSDGRGNLGNRNNRKNISGIRSGFSGGICNGESGNSIITSAKSH